MDEDEESRRKTIDEDVQKARKNERGRIEKYSGHVRLGVCTNCACTVAVRNKIKCMYAQRDHVRGLRVFA